MAGESFVLCWCEHESGRVSRDLPRGHSLAGVLGAAAGKALAERSCITIMEGRSAWAESCQTRSSSFFSFFLIAFFIKKRKAGVNGSWALERVRVMGHQHPLKKSVTSPGSGVKRSAVTAHEFVLQKNKNKKNTAHEFSPTRKLGTPVEQLLQHIIRG